jgi:voltage-gated potassium channel
MTLQHRVTQISSMLVIVTVAGTIGYVLIEGWRVFDALYMTVITIATIGYGEIHQLSTAGRAFTMVLIVGGVGVVAYGFSALTALLVEGAVSDHIWERRMERQIGALRNHVIVCGGGQIGRHVTEELEKAEMPFVVIEMDEARCHALKRSQRDVLIIAGDATEIDVLRRARVEHAFGLAACMPSDRDNLFTLLAARELNPTMQIVSRLILDDASSRLRKVGADAVVSTAQIGALRIASEVLRPHVVSVLDAMLREPSPIRVQEVRVGASVAGRTLRDLGMQEKVGAIVFAMREAGTRRHVFNPLPDRVLAEDDVLILCADPAQLEAARLVANHG